MGTGNLAILEAQILHRLSMLMAHERVLNQLAYQHPLIDPLYFSDLRLALLSCVLEFERIYKPITTQTQRTAEVEQMPAER